MSPLMPIFAAGVLAGLLVHASMTGAGGLTIGLQTGCFTATFLIALWKILDAVKK